jgi:adenylate kinase
MLKKIFILLCVTTHLYALESVLVLFGPPGAGKGTFSQYVKDQDDYVHLSVGDIIRDEIDRQTEIGKPAAESLQRGGFLDEEMIQAVVLKHIAPLAAGKKRFILDGFPRTPEAVYFIQECFDRFEMKDQVLLIMLRTSDETCQERILSRLICKGCGHVYNAITAPPKEENICDHCSMPLKTRSNDILEIVKTRLEEYHDVTEKAYDIAKSLFPSIEFETEMPLEDCILNYRRTLDAR